MKAFLNRLMSNFVFKAAGSSQRKCTTEPPPQGPLEDMASRRRRNTPKSLKREVSEVNIKPLEPPRKKQRTSNTLSDRSEAIQHSNVVNSELTAMTVASSSDYLSTLDDASVEDILSVAHLLDSTPSRSPTPVLAFDIPSSDDYDVTTPGSSTVLDFDNDDPGDLYPNSSTHICGLFEEPYVFRYMRSPLRHTSLMKAIVILIWLCSKMQLVFVPHIVKNMDIKTSGGNHHLTPRWTLIWIYVCRISSLCRVTLSLQTNLLCHHRPDTKRMSCPVTLCLQHTLNRPLGSPLGLHTIMSDSIQI